METIQSYFEMRPLMNFSNTSSHNLDIRICVQSDMKSCYMKKYHYLTIKISFCNTKLVR